MLVRQVMHIMCAMTKRIAFAVVLMVAGGAASGAEFLITGDQDIIGAPRVVQARYEDTFVSLARTHNVGFEALRRANPGVDAWLPGEGAEIVVPAQYVLPKAERRGIVINLPELRLYYFPDDDGRRVITYPISIGRMDWGTPLGRTTIVSKQRNPSWYPPQSIRDEHAARNDPLPLVVPPGPDNPLGNHALRLAIPGYLIHGTNRPSGVGMRVTHGCIRMFPEDIEALFEMVGPGTQVRIVNQPVKLGWGQDGLYLEAHLPLDEDRQSEEWSAATELTRAFVAATEERQAQILQWDSAEDIIRDARGIPQFVSASVMTAEAEDMPAAFDSPFSN